MLRGYLLAEARRLAAQVVGVLTGSCQAHIRTLEEDGNFVASAVELCMNVGTVRSVRAEELNCSLYDWYVPVSPSICHNLYF